MAPTRGLPTLGLPLAQGDNVLAGPAAAGKLGHVAAVELFAVTGTRAG
jgi:hypothetical protein